MAGAGGKNPVLKGILKGVQKIALILLVVYAVAWWIEHKLPYSDYRQWAFLPNRMAIWGVAQLHLMLAAFVLGVPIFACIVEIVGTMTKDDRYDRMAKEFTKLLFNAFTTTAVFGAMLLLTLVYCYPKFFHYMYGIFSPTWTLYICLIFGEVIFAYMYWYSWEPLSSKEPLPGFVRLTLNVILTLVCGVLAAGVLLLIYGSLLAVFKLVNYTNPDASHAPLNYTLLTVLGVVWLYVLFVFFKYWLGTESSLDRKKLHFTVGIFLNLFGTALLMVANSWATFMMTPAGVDQNGNLKDIFQAVFNYAWMPLNIHRLIANVAFGGAVVASYSAFRFLSATSQKDKAHYDWMGYTGNLISICALIPLPFAGYLLGREIYEFNQTMGVNMMGGIYSFLWIIQAALIGGLFFAANYYLWLGMGRMQGAERYRGAIKWLMLVLALSFAVWATPHTLIVSLSEMRALGGAFHPILGRFGYMNYKVTVVNFMILTTFISFILYRRSNKVETVSWGMAGKMIQYAILFVTAAAVLFLGVKGEHIASEIRVEVFSPSQVGMVLLAMMTILVIDILMYRNAKIIGEIEWGKMPPRAQYALIFLAVSFTWLMGLMGYIRSAIRQYWHIWGIMADTSGNGYTPSIGQATITVSIIVFVFFLIVSVIFWMGIQNEKKEAEGSAPAAAAPAPST